MWIRFQFQFGAIKSKAVGTYETQLSHFNSNLVRLKDLSSHPVCPPCRNFNTNLVRLKVTYLFIVRRLSLVFQFQFGTIKRDKLAQKYYELSGFQFQFGAIKRPLHQ